MSFARSSRRSIHVLSTPAAPSAFHGFHRGHLQLTLHDLQISVAGRYLLWDHVQAIGTGAIGDTAADTATAHGRGFGLKILRQHPQGHPKGFRPRGERGQAGQLLHPLLDGRLPLVATSRDFQAISVTCSRRRHRLPRVFQPAPRKGLTGVSTHLKFEVFQFLLNGQLLLLQQICNAQKKTSLRLLQCFLVQQVP